VAWALVAPVVLAVLAVLAVCLLQPVSIGVRAPDDGDLLTLRVRHPAVSLDLWVPVDTVIHWLAGIPEPPPISGHIAGVPLPQRALAPVADAIAKQIAGLLRPKTEEPAPVEPETAGRFDALKKHVIAAAPKAAWETVPRFRKAVVIELATFDLLYGTGNPVTTALIAGYLWQLAAVLPEPCYVRAEANWMEPALRAEGEARVLIFPWRTIVAVLCLLLAISHGAWKSSRRQPPSKETDSWPIRTETTAAAAAPPSNPY
jgi:hypothetical protein